MHELILGDELNQNDLLDLNINNFFKIAKIQVKIDFILVYDFSDNTQLNIRNMIIKNFIKAPEYKTCNFRGKKKFIAIFWEC